MEVVGGNRAQRRRMAKAQGEMARRIASLMEVINNFRTVYDEVVKAAEAGEQHTDAIFVRVEGGGGLITTDGRPLGKQPVKLVGLKVPIEAIDQLCMAQLAVLQQNDAMKQLAEEMGVGIPGGDEPEEDG